MEFMNNLSSFHCTLVYPKLMTTLLNTTEIKVFSYIIGKNFIQYSLSIKGNTIRHNSKKYFLYYKDRDMI